MTNTPNNIAGEEWADPRVEAFITLWKKHFVHQEDVPCSDCGGFVVHVCEKALREMLTAQVKKMDDTIQEAIAGERERIANELARRVLKIEEMVTDERGLHLIVNPDELEDGMAQLFTGNIFVYLLDR